MSVARKPRNVDEFITGATVAQETSAAESDSSDSIAQVKMRIPIELLNELDEARAQRKPKPSRHQFMLEALYDKLRAAQA